MGYKSTAVRCDRLVVWRPQPMLDSVVVSLARNGAVNPIEVNSDVCVYSRFSIQDTNAGMRSHR